MRVFFAGMIVLRKIWKTDRDVLTDANQVPLHQEIVEQENPTLKRVPVPPVLSCSPVAQARFCLR